MQRTQARPHSPQLQSAASIAGTQRRAAGPGNAALLEQLSLDDAELSAAGPELDWLSPSLAGPEPEVCLDAWVAATALDAEQVMQNGSSQALDSWLVGSLGAAAPAPMPVSREKRLYEQASAAVADAMARVNQSPAVGYPGRAPTEWAARLDSAVEAGTVEEGKAQKILRSWVDQCRPGYNASFEPVARNRPFVFFKRADVSAYDAIEAFITGFTVADCYAMSAAAELWGVAQAMGREAFNWNYERWAAQPRNSQKPFIQGVPDGTFLSEYTTAIPDGGGSESFPVETARVQADHGEFDVRVGDKAYFHNHDDFKKAHPRSPWGGENVVCSGIETRGGKTVALWSGFGPFTNVTAEEILRELWRVYQEPPTSDYTPPEYSSFEAFTADPVGARLTLRSPTDGYRLDPKRILQGIDNYDATRAR